METGRQKPKSRAQKPGYAKTGPKKPGHAQSEPNKQGHKKSKPNKLWSKNKPKNQTNGTAQNRHKPQKSARPQPSAAETKLVLFNKPYQVLCQFSADGDKATLADFMHIPEVYPAGRLDYESEGLLLLTNNGQLQHKISHPTAKMEKTYAVQVEGIPTEEQLNALRVGVVLNDGPTKPSTVTIMENQQAFPEREPPIRKRKNIPDTWIELTISEGRNKQVRRMTAAVGLPTLRLIRTKIGQYELTDLEPGEWRLIKNISL